MTYTCDNLSKQGVKKEIKDVLVNMNYKNNDLYIFDLY